MGPAGGVTPFRGEWGVRCHRRVTRVMWGHWPVMRRSWCRRVTQVRRRHRVSVSTWGAVLSGSRSQVIVRRETMMTQVMRIMMMVRRAMMVTMVTSVMTRGEMGRTLGVMRGRGMIHWPASAAGSVRTSVGGGPAHYNMSHVSYPHD